MKIDWEYPTPFFLLDDDGLLYRYYPVSTVNWVLFEHRLRGEVGKGGQWKRELSGEGGT